MTQLKLNSSGNFEIEKKDFGTSDSYADNAGWMPMLAGPGYAKSHTGIEVNPVTALQSGVAYACIRILCGDVSKLPLRLLRRNKDDIWVEARNHPVSRLLRKPNKRMTQADMLTLITASLLLTGNAFTAVVRNAKGAPVTLIPLLPTTVSIRESQDGNLYYQVWNRLLNDKSTTYDEEDMIHIRALSLDGGIHGSSPVQLCADVFGLGIGTQELAAYFFKNAANFNGFLTTAEKLNKEAAEQIADQWSRNHAGLRNSGKTPVLQYGMDFKQISMNAEQAQMIESRKQIIQEIAMCFGIPGYKLGFNEKSSYNSIDAQSIDYIDGTLRPLLNPIEQALNRTLLFDKEFDDYKFSFDLKEMERGDIKTELMFLHQMLMDGVFSVNEVRKNMNMEGIGAEGDIRTRPLNTGVVGQSEGLPNYTIDSPTKIDEDETPKD